MFVDLISVTDSLFHHSYHSLSLSLSPFSLPLAPFIYSFIQQILRIHWVSGPLIGFNKCRCSGNYLLTLFPISLCLFSLLSHSLDFLYYCSDFISPFVLSLFLYLPLPQASNWPIHFSAALPPHSEFLAPYPFSETHSVPRDSSIPEKIGTDISTAGLPNESYSLCHHCLHALYVQARLGIWVRWDLPEALPEGHHLKLWDI